MLSDEQILNGEWSQEELIKNFMPLARNIVKRFPHKYIERDEALSIAFEELTRCLINVEIKSIPQLIGYIRQNIRRKIKHHCLRYYSRSLIARKDERSKPTLTLNAKIEPSYVDVDLLTVDFQDTVDKIIKKPMERTILERILEGGYTLNDLSEELGVSRQHIGKLKENILWELLCELQK